MTKDIIINKEHLITKKFSISMKNKNMSVDDFYSRIKENTEITYEAMLKERMGFWKVGQLLNKAKKELRQGFKQLSKRLINDRIIEEKQCISEKKSEYYQSIIMYDQSMICLYQHTKRSCVCVCISIH